LPTADDDDIDSARVREFEAMTPQQHVHEAIRRLVDHTPATGQVSLTAANVHLLLAIVKGGIPEHVKP
jgi:hypothetical protein